MTEVQQEYLQWMGNPQREGSKVQWAKDHAVSVATLYKWEKAEWYQSGLEQTMREMHLSMDKTLEVIAAVQKQAARGDIQSAKLYLQFLERVQPMKSSTTRGDLANMTDDEIQAALLGAID
jgi:hypothetical protein